ncbi:metallophosphoesterase [uncultured Rikenella sp.]|uniref:metallophosphoesterase n=1 Tax=uncultured Rikenella sp. TaxID=368003 RepID=UPI00261684CC|nr:metallophosphoesterase [uncultured Rikenella sp.]
MMVYLLLTAMVCSMASDFYVWHRYFRGKAKPVGRVILLVQAVLLDLVLPAALYAVNGTFGREEEAAQAMLWLMWVFLLFFVSKTVFALFSGIGALLNRGSRKRRRFFEAVGGVLAASVVCIMIYGASHGISTIRVNRIEVTSPKVPEAFDGYRIAQFSDLHIGNLAPSGTLMTDIVDTILALKPDLIVNCGDLVNIRSSEITPDVFRRLSRLKAPDGVVSVLGNHDFGIYVPGSDTAAERSLERLKEIQRALGWKLLQNEHIWLERGADRMAVAGVDFPHKDRRNGVHAVKGGSDLRRAMQGVDTSCFSLLVSHTPALWDSIPQTAAPDLTVAGHVHAMQMKLNLGRLHLSPAEFLYPEWSGLYVKGGLRLYVNDGVGYVLFPMRIGALPEVTLFELRRSAE